MNNEQYRMVLRRGMEEAGMSKAAKFLPRSDLFNGKTLKTIVGEDQNPANILFYGFIWDHTPNRHCYWRNICSNLRTKLENPFDWNDLMEVPENEPKEFRYSNADIKDEFFKEGKDLMRDIELRGKTVPEINDDMKHRDLKGFANELFSPPKERKQSQPQPWFSRMAPLNAKLSPFK